MEQASAYQVQLASGEHLEVLTQVEQRWFERAKSNYLEQTKFSDHTDLVDLDRLLQLELMVFRWSQHLSAGRDYEGDASDDNQLRRNLKDQSEAINRLKTRMGLTKEARAKILEAGNFSHAWDDLKRRAKQFGVHREEQLRAALTLMNELSAILGAFDRADVEERRRLGFATETDILDWIRTRMLPEYAELDAYFRQHVQRLWTRESL